MHRGSFTDSCSPPPGCRLLSCGMSAHIHVRSSSCALSVIYWSLSRYRLLATVTGPATSRWVPRHWDCAAHDTPSHSNFSASLTVLITYICGRTKEYKHVPKRRQILLLVCCCPTACMLLSYCFLSARSSWMWCLHAHSTPYKQSSVTN